MTKEEHIQYWRESSQRDLDSAGSMCDAGRYEWCLFAGHLALEKILKAIFVDKHENDMPLSI